LAIGMERRSDGGAEVACWAHCRRSIFDVWQTTRSTVAKAALDRIAQFYAN